MLDESCLREWQDSLAPISWCPIDVIAIDLESVVESALFAKHAQRWPVLFDPHGVALKWVCASEKHLAIVHGSGEHCKLHRAIEAAAPLGTSVLLKDIREGDLRDAAKLIELIPRCFESINRTTRGANEAKHNNEDRGLLGHARTRVSVGPSSFSNVVDLREDFRFFITTQQIESPMPEVIWDGREQLVLIDFALSHSALQMEMLRVVVSHEQTSLYKEGMHIVQQDARNKQRIDEVEKEVLVTLTESARTDGSSVLDDGLAIEKSHTLMEEVRGLREQRSEIDASKRDLYHAHGLFASMAQAARVFFSAISDLIHVQAAYAFSLEWFVDKILVNTLMQSVSSNLESMTETEQIAHVEQMRIKLVHTLYCRVSSALLSKDRLLFALLLAVRPHLAQGCVGDAEWQFLLTGVASGSANNHLLPDLTAKIGRGSAAPITATEHDNPAKTWLPDKQWDEMCSLATLSTFSGLIEEFEAQIKMWKRIYDAPEPHEQPLPRHWDADLQGVNRLCILRCLRPDQIANAVRGFVRIELGDNFLDGPPASIDAIISESEPGVPIVVITTHDNKAAAVNLVLEAGGRLGHSITQILAVPGCVDVADAILSQAVSKGSWVTVQNPQLCPELTWRLELTNRSCGSVDANSKFRLWCVMDVSTTLSANVLRYATKFAYERLCGVRAVVLNLYKSALARNSDFLTCCTRGNEFRRLFFALCICHSILRERVSYGSLGWNTAYQFQTTDLLMSSEQLISLLDNHEDNQGTAPFAAIKLCLKEYIYGGHIIDHIDRRLLGLIIDRFCCSDVLRPGHALSPSGEFRMPLQDGNQASWLRTVEGLPPVAPLEFLGFHDSATVEKNNNETASLLSAVFLAEGAHRNIAGDFDGFRKAEERANTLLSIMPLIVPGAGPVETRKISSAGKFRFTDAVLLHELSKYDVLTEKIRKTLSSATCALMGSGPLSPFLKDTILQIENDQLPSTWYSESYLSNSRLTSYIHDLVLRYKFFSSWLLQQAPSLYWLSAFFSPVAFLSATQVDFAIHLSHDVLSISLKSNVLSNCEENSTSLESPAHGVHVKGIFIHSARWDVRRQGLVDCLPKSQFATAPVIWFEPVVSGNSTKAEGGFTCPLYRTSSRSGQFSSDGQSNNFVICVCMPSPLPASHWTERGAAMLLQLD